MKKKLFSIIILFFVFCYLLSDTINAADCSEVAPIGNLTLTTSCTFSGTVNGVDNGTGSQNTASLTMASTGTLTVGATQKVAMGSLTIQTGGSIAIFDGGSLNFGTPLWMTDLDTDGYPSDTTQYAQSIPPPSGRRRNEVVTMTIPDTNDAVSCPVNFNPDGVCNLCQNGGIANQPERTDPLNDCPGAFDSCNGAGACSLFAKRVFASSTTYNGNLGGLTGADTKCQTLADSVSLGGTWKAWLSNTTTSAASRLTQSADPYVLVDNTTKIADNWTTLTDGALDHAINLTQAGQSVATGSRVWTNTRLGGTIFTSTSSDVCTNWTSALSSRDGRTGISSSFTNDDWTNASYNNCSNNRRLYCFEQ